MRKYYQRRLPENPLKDYYYIIRETDPMQSLLVEYGFIDNPTDQVRLENNLLDYTEAVVRAIANYGGFNYTSPSGSSNQYYTVQSGDSLWSIANRFGTTVTELRRLNNLSSDTLQIGQVLRVSEGNNSGGNNGGGSSGTTTYTVQRNDSLWSIANRFGTTVAELRRLNNLSSDTLQIGQVLIISESSNNGGNNSGGSGSETTYTVKRGDSLWSIASRYGISVNELRNANNLTSDVLQIGQILVIPTGNSSGGSNSGGSNTGTVYTVQRNDSLWSIANRFGTTVDALKAANDLTSNTLQIGQQLIIPGVVEDTTTTTFYTVQNGDSLWLIADRYNTTVDNLKRLNNLSSNVLQIGQQLLVPVS